MLAAFVYKRSLISPAKRFMPSPWRARPKAYLDGRKYAYRGLPEREHTERVIGPMAAHILMPWIHRVFANLKRLAMGVYHGFRRKYLQAYLDEFVFRWNRRRHYRVSFDSLLGIGLRIEPCGLRSLRTEYA